MMKGIGFICLVKCSFLEAKPSSTDKRSVFNTKKNKDPPEVKTFFGTDLYTNNYPIPDLIYIVYLVYLHGRHQYCFG